MSVSAEDREKAIEAVARALRPSDFWNETAEYPTAAREDYEAGQEVARIEAFPVVDALIAAGWGPGGAPARPTREALIEALFYPDHDKHVFRYADPRLTLEDDEYLQEMLTDLLAADHLWAEQPSEDPYKVAHIECDCVPEDGPSHCHLCGDRLGRIIPWSEAHPSAPVVDREALAEFIWRSQMDSSLHHLTWAEYPFKEYRQRQADAAIASGLFVDRASVEREAAANALETFADDLPLNRTVADAQDTARTRAAEYREGKR